MEVTAPNHRVSRELITSLRPVAPEILANPQFARRVAVCLDPASGSDRLVLMGIADHVCQSERWALELIDLESRSLDSGDGPAGIIVSSGFPISESSFLTHSIPLVIVGSSAAGHMSVQRILLDEGRAAELAADTLFGCRPATYAILGAGDPSADEFNITIREAFAGKGINPICIDSPDATNNLSDLAGRLADCPKPMGVIARTMRHAHRLREACAMAGIVVPDEVAILSMTGESLVARLVPPRLACLGDGWRALGRAAASELARLMAGGAIGPPILVAPTTVSRGESLAGKAVPNDLVAGALKFIRANAHREIHTGDLLAELECSRRNLERHFQQAVGHGPAAAIRNARLALAHRLLSETAMPMKTVAQQCGFASVEQLRRQLRATTSLTPSQYRQTHRAPSE
jgi:LacI family transcriptional regulator